MIIFIRGGKSLIFTDIPKSVIEDSRTTNCKEFILLFLIAFLVLLSEFRKLTSKCFTKTDEPFHLFPPLLYC